MARTWRIVVLVMLLAAGSVGTAAAQGKGNGGGNGNGGGPGSGEQCLNLIYDNGPDAPVVVLDPGHGGSDPGATNPAFGLVEMEQNLIIGNFAADILGRSGYTVALTRTDNGTTLGNSDRGAIANACGAAVFVEIHLNASSDPGVNYSQAFWGKKRKDLAFATHMSGYLAPLTGDGRVGQYANGGLLHAEMPSALLETVFITSTAEAELLAAGMTDGTHARQRKIASAIASGIASWT